ncbi:MAG: DUF2165 family protein [Gemmobacter sp.]|uniref:DUF2165 family protein n=1 Tax=Gemmobacter sp. TaxID=1898957 RepID=UPI00391A40C6
METILPLVQAGVLALMAAWLTLGLRDNLVHPDLNETFTAEVLSLARMKRDYAAIAAMVAHRAIDDRRTQRRLFRLIVAAEALVVLALWVAVATLCAHLAGLLPHAPAQAVGLLAAFGFTALWGAFLVAGNHFCYWFCHDAAQNTHFQLALWGMGAMLLLVQAP